MSTPYTEARENRTFASFFAAGVSVLALLFAALSFFVTRGTSSSGAAAGGGASATVTLSEYKISPATISVSPGRVVLNITNTGTLVHNLSVTELGKRTPDVAPGASTTLDLGEVDAGTYQVQCLVAGHAGLGMTGTLVVGAATAATTATTASMAAMDMTNTDPNSPAWKAIDDQMKKGMAANLDTFVKGGSTQGVGSQKLTPTIDADGTKVFHLTASIVDWQTAPGTTVKAWAYNGMVPGPWIRTEPGDHVRVVFTDNLPVSTEIHWHGITTPFPMDGVAPITQDFIAPGTSFTYEWTNPNHPEMGMYHAHEFGEVAVVNGMFGVFQIGDLPLPSGQTISGRTLPADLTPTQELPIVLNDAGVIGLTLNGKSYPATAPITAAPGDKLLVHYYNEGLQAHPMHLHHVPQLVVAKDGFPLDHPYWADTILVAPGERYSALVMPTADDIGVWAWHCHILIHAENAQGLFGMVTALIVAEPKKG